MKSRYFLISICLLIMSTLASVAQTDLTHKIINPSFEENIDAMATGWTYEGGSEAYAWHVINTDGDATKDGNNICGLWNPKFGDVAITQTITGLENGVYVVTAGVMVGVNGATPGQRLTTQRLFANNNSVLYGAEADYSADNISVLTGTLGETISYAGYGVSTAENGPFSVCTVETKVTDGTLVFGIKTNGTDSQYNFSFPGADESGWGWFKIDNFTLTLKGGATGIKTSLKKDITVRVNNGYVLVEGAACYKIHDLNGREIKNNVQLKRGIYIVSADSQTVKVAVK
jgi:hypothetical protein